ncbi:hypothetical protein DFJ74DRAFT_726236 [Hyaloraphidium curvatum]|nr:hypothetical protein DFJ74DRAFT_726236 [Hyaloraphidium curvatum]
MLDLLSLIVSNRTRMPECRCRVTLHRPAVRRRGVRIIAHRSDFAATLVVGSAASKGTRLGRTALPMPHNMLSPHFHQIHPITRMTAILDGKPKAAPNRRYAVRSPLSAAVTNSRAGRAACKTARPSPVPHRRAGPATMVSNQGKMAVAASWRLEFRPQNRRSRPRRPGHRRHPLPGPLAVPHGRCRHGIRPHPQCSPHCRRRHRPIAAERTTAHPRRAPARRDRPRRPLRSITDPAPHASAPSRGCRKGTPSTAPPLRGQAARARSPPVRRQHVARRWAGPARLAGPSAGCRRTARPARAEGAAGATAPMPLEAGARERAAHVRSAGGRSTG